MRLALKQVIEDDGPIYDLVKFSRRIIAKWRKELNKKPLDF